MDVFAFRDGVLGDYHRYVESFLEIKDKRIREFVKEELERGVLWPEALVQLNPSYEKGKTVEELVEEGLLHPLCRRIFRDEKTGGSIRLFKHQEEAVRTAAKAEPYVLTTGTGSGKSLTYLIPIFINVLKNQPERKTVRALVVYPMNALINSQCEAIKRLAQNLPEGEFPIRWARYTGQENREEKTRIRENPPHVILTNYVMLEYIMTRPEERMFVDRTLTELKFLVLDELHTYGGRQGADVAMLVRRLRRRCGNPNILCIGTSATMAAGGTRQERRGAVAEVAGKMFGVSVKPDNVIDETLKRVAINPAPSSPEELREAVEGNLPETSEAFVSSPLTAWVEETFGIEEQDGHLTRRSPITVRDGAEKLGEATGTDVDRCEERLKAFFHHGSEISLPDGSPIFGFKLHQFISQGGSVYASLEPPDKRHLTLEGQQYVRGEEETDRLLLPLVFCRDCGQEYYLVAWNQEAKQVEPRLPLGTSEEYDESFQAGYLLLDDPEEPIWDESREEELPEQWFRTTKKGRKVKKEYADFVPQKLRVRADGHVVEEEGGGELCWFLAQPFLTCLNCGAVYTKRDKVDFRKLARLSSEGRSTATTLLAISSVTQMRREGSLPESARKLLSFTDNRQDAALQAGHFNDFVQVASLRSAIYRALPENGSLDHSTIASEVVKSLGLEQKDYAREAGEYGALPARNREALTALVEYRIYEDLRRGWRVVQPNLEQCGLVKIDYQGLQDVCQAQEPWAAHPLLAKTDPEGREWVARAFLNHLRRNLAIDAGCLDPEKQGTLRLKVNQTLKEPWVFDDDEYLREWGWFCFGGDWELGWNQFSLGPRGLVGRFLRSCDTWGGLSADVSESEYQELVRAFLEALRSSGFLRIEKDGEGMRVQVQASSILWKRGDGRALEPDPIRSRRMGGSREEEGPREANEFFSKLYSESAADLVGLEGREHTGQTRDEDRQERERRFRDGDLECLFCSPTMELGIDIADLNVVHMRNVPPSPANYAQRSGRAGRIGQPAFITTYCSVGSGHDQYFYRHRAGMVSGVVVPPPLDLSNEDLVRSHVHSVWLAATGISLKDSITEVVDAGTEGIPLMENVAHQVELSEPRLRECFEDCKHILERCGEELAAAGWYSEEWLWETLKTAHREFDRAFDRWREMYLAAHSQLQEARATIDRSHRTRVSKDEVDEAKARQREAERQKDLLCNQGQKDEADFYPYRYLASEGFLPGYNFPRLPVRAYVPKGDQGSFIARPRFLALTEFGPRNIVYHEGRKYRVVRSLLPVGEGEGLFARAKLCNVCGSFHEGDSAMVDLCENCGTRLDASTSKFLQSLFEMRPVVCQRADRITCDEEERVRWGYETTTHFRFAPEPGGQRKIIATVRGEDGTQLVELTYGPAATLWRINHGWRRRKELGFHLDYRRGIWEKRPDEGGDTAIDAAQNTVRSGVRLFVRDTRNVLLLRLSRELENQEEVLINLQHSLCAGLLATFQIEEGEVASERIGDGEQRSILLWEAAEGGVGVLGKLVNEPEAFARVAREALGCCHFDMDTGEDLKGGEDGCARACYDCLMTYTNQPDHLKLDRHQVKDFLLALSKGHTQQAHGQRNYDEHYQWLRSLTDPSSRLERDFLDQLYRTGRRLPDYAQRTIEDYPSRPDFYYEHAHACIFCDGPPHDTPEQKAEDERVRGDLRDLGYRVIVIRYDEDLEEQVSQHPEIFGEPKS